MFAPLSEKLLDKYAFVLASKEEKGPYYKAVGSGQYGAVFVGRLRCDAGGPPVQLAIKRSIPPNFAASQRTLLRELDVLRGFRAEAAADRDARETLVQVLDTYIEEDPDSREQAIYLVMELSPLAKSWGVRYRSEFTVPLKRDIKAQIGGTSQINGSHGGGADLCDNSIAPLPVSVFHAKYILVQVLKALSFLHRHSIVHRDVKPDNCIVFGSRMLGWGWGGVSLPVVKLTDFGFARFLAPEHDPTSFVGTKAFMAPEMFQRGSRYDFKVDVFAVGCLFYTLVLCANPTEMSAAQLQVERDGMGVGERARFAAPAFRVHFPVGSPQDRFLQALTHPDPAMRPSSIDALNDPFLLGFDLPPEEAAGGAGGGGGAAAAPVGAVGGAGGGGAAALAAGGGAAAVAAPGVGGGAADSVV